MNSAKRYFDALQHEHKAHLRQVAAEVYRQIARRLKKAILLQR